MSASRRSVRRGLGRKIRETICCQVAPCYAQTGSKAEAVLVWCDKLASTPGMGFAFDASLTPSASILAALAPVFEEWVLGHNDKLDFTIEKLDPFFLQVTSTTGYQYIVTPSKISVEFTHRLKLRQKTGGPPVAELTSEALPFTALMPEISKRLVAAAMLLPRIETRKLTRVGIISTTALDETMMPPGIARFIKYMARPWQGAVENYSFMLTSELRKETKSIDKCVHYLVKSDDPDQLPTIRFDWQRWFNPGQSVRMKLLESALDGARDSAMTYLEQLAEGNCFDEDILRSGA